MNRWLVIAVTFIILTVVALGGMFVALISYVNQTRDVDTKIAIAESAARKEQADIDEEKYAELEKAPSRQFVGPSDYGEVRFDYPKTWSTYVSKDAASSNSTFEAYLNPVSVPPVSTTQRYALRVLIESKDYDRVVSSYESAVSRGDLTSSVVRVAGQTGTRLDGLFSKDIRGAAVIFKIRDKTLTLRTDANTFKADFDKLVKSLTFNQ